MVNPKAWSTILEEYDKEILCPLSSSCYPQKDYMALLAKSHPKGIFGVTPYVGMTID